MQKIKILDSFHFDGEQFLKSLIGELAALGLDLSGSTIDHLCYRVQSDCQYQELKENLKNLGTLLSEAMINGRPISTFRLHRPFRHQSHSINLVELPSPKQGTQYDLGFEHAEAVIDQHFEDFEKQYPHLKFQLGGDRNTNPELSLKTKMGQLKFHYQSLDRVIEIENSNITDVIFDFDGTIIQSRENIYEITSLVFSQTLQRQVTVTEAKEKYFPEFGKLFDAFDINCPKAKADTILNWSQISSQFSYALFDGITDTLAFLKEQKYNLHLWTARDQASTLRILEQHNLYALFETISCATEVSSKPDPNSLTFQFRDRPKNSILVIGDSASDIIGAKNMGAISSGALWDPHSNPSILVSHKADLLFYKTEEFLTWLKSRAQGMARSTLFVKKTNDPIRIHYF